MRIKPFPVIVWSLALVFHVVNVDKPTFVGCSWIKPDITVSGPKPTQFKD